MSTIFDYIAWRGDLPLSASPFNNVDNLILCRLSYIAFDGIVPPPGTYQSVSVSDACRQFLESGGSVLLKNDRRFAEEIAKSRRFGKMRLWGYVNNIDDKVQKQFSAMTVTLDDRTAYVLYRGTDDTFVGWKEDFNMSFMDTVPAQREAVDYLNLIAYETALPLRVGGHSKGGNLAVYAAVFCEAETQARIIDVYCNDGPGFSPSVIESEGYARILPHVRMFVPQSSLIGMLLEHGGERIIVHSTQRGILQHDIYSWDVGPLDLVTSPSLTKGSIFLSSTFRQWLSGMEPDSREKFIDAFYRIIEDTNVRTLADFTSNWFKNASIMLQSLRNTDDETKALMSEGLSVLSKAVRSSIPEFFTKNSANTNKTSRDKTPLCRK